MELGAIVPRNWLGVTHIGRSSSSRRRIPAAVVNEGDYTLPIYMDVLFLAKNSVGLTHADRYSHPLLRKYYNLHRLLCAGLTLDALLALPLLRFCCCCCYYTILAPIKVRTEDGTLSRDDILTDKAHTTMGCLQMM